MQRLEVEDQVQLAHVLKQLVERLHEHLDQVEEAQGRLERVGDDDEVQRCVVAVQQRGRLVPGGGVPGRGGRRAGEEWREAVGVLINTGRLPSWWRRANLREEVAGRCRTIGDEGEDLGQQLLL